MKKDTVKFNYYYNFFKNSPHFSNLSDEVILEILPMFSAETWKKGDYPFNSELTKNKCYFIISGRIKVFQINSVTGKEYIIEILEAGNIFDIICLLDSEEHHVFTEALDDVEALVVPMQLAKEWISKHPEFNKTLLPYLGSQMRFYEENATDLALLSTWSRTVKLFVKHINTNLHSSQLKLINNLSHTDLANMIGSARNVLNRHLQKLKEDDVIAVQRNHIEIINIDALLNEVYKK
ncbi:Crp/Fnr family transcriptional regulator [Lutibacter sp.]|uniref:Crp/Fnr family transcriptional regulator n=1 Tax=Lutibacter sp. TaxID=1925666 RepID=UPI0025BA1A06|nr:Crp/Fnr family transcriptional regulator [Lutibacter sp.]MCF6182354.1 Crp/Fnr family transcriptional regulator [Lutibacter sp.]